MNISREWLQTYFDKPLPEAQTLADALTFHAFEIDGIDPVKSHGDHGAGAGDDWVLDVKVTPNRGHDCLSHRGIAKEISAILDVPMKADPLRQEVALEPKTEDLQVKIEDAKHCPRFSACRIKGLTVGPSPEWLRKRLDVIGQRSINNVVDATNYVMFDLGQPLHAFDADKLVNSKQKTENGKYQLNVRGAKAGEKMVGLDDKEYELTDSMLVIADSSGAAVSIAGVKGGKPTGVDENTTDIILEAANWEGTMIRKTSQALKLKTDASERFQQVISPELTAYGLSAAAQLIADVAGGDIAGYVDEYPGREDGQREVYVSVQKINAVLGTSLKPEAIADVFRRLDLPCDEVTPDSFSVRVPLERLDLQIPEDLIEEVGRIVGYDSVPAMELPKFGKEPDINGVFLAAERKREELVAEGYSEVFTSVFADEGERAVLNKVDSTRPYLRANLVDGLKEALVRNEHNKDLLGLKEVRLFEIGMAWKGGTEVLMLGTADADGVREVPLEEAKADAYDALPVSTTEKYRPFSKYPFIVRDIALWVPSGEDSEEVLKVIRSHAGELLVRSEKFDEYKNEKTGKTSYAFRLVFQSFDRTLTDEEANVRMESVYQAAKKEGWEVR
ncbi:MAG: phenylalanine--tRNA ligase subunit beta [Patescibacteria group bacterium]|nr:phenylalanine--tRNA ligase subunit beta [Patescibacteria group bacterium]